MMLVDCQTCPVRDVRCADCMVTALTAIPLRSGATAAGGPRERHRRPDARPPRPRALEGRGEPHEVVTAPLDRAERRAVSAFLAAGLVSTATANAARAELDQVDQREQVGHGRDHRTRRAV